MSNSRRTSPTASRPCARAIHEADDIERLRLATVIEQTAEAVMITDPNASIVYVNPAFEQVTGYAAAEVIGQNTRILQSGLQSREFYADMWSTSEGRQDVDGRARQSSQGWGPPIRGGLDHPVVDARGALASYVAVKARRHPPA